MIDIAKLTEADKGREVKYANVGITEIGRITSWNDRFVFVSYHAWISEMGETFKVHGFPSKATRPEDLEWL